MDPGGGYQLTDDGFAVLISFEGHFAITNKEREVEQVLYRLAEIFWVDDELEEVDLPTVFSIRVGIVIDAL